MAVVAGNHGEVAHRKRLHVELPALARERDAVFVVDLEFDRFLTFERVDDFTELLRGNRARHLRTLDANGGVRLNLNVKVGCRETDVGPLLFDQNVAHNGERLIALDDAGNGFDGG